VSFSLSNLEAEEEERFSRFIYDESGDLINEKKTGEFSLV